MPLLEPMLILVLPLDLLVGMLMLVLELLVELGMLVRVEALSMCLRMLFLKLVVNVGMLLVEMIMLPLVPPVAGITVIATIIGLVGIAVAGVVARITAAIARPDREREYALGRCGDWSQSCEGRGTAKKQDCLNMHWTILSLTIPV